MSGMFDGLFISMCVGSIQERRSVHHCTKEYNHNKKDKIQKITKCTIVVEIVDDSYIDRCRSIPIVADPYRSMPIPVVLNYNDDTL